LLFAICYDPLDKTDRIVVVGSLPTQSNDNGALENLKFAGVMHYDANAIEYGRGVRLATRAKNKQDVMLAMVWSMPHCRRLFAAYPEVLYIDGTHCTNVEHRPLITIGLRDGSFKMNVIFRAFVPNERAWTFQWLFCDAIPYIFGADSCKRVKLIVTDGDSTEFGQLDDAIGKGIYGSARRRRCGWQAYIG
jgi:MULE transposase domain